MGINGQDLLIWDLVFSVTSYFLWSHSVKYNSMMFENLNRIASALEYLMAREMGSTALWSSNLGSLFGASIPGFVVDPHLACWKPAFGKQLPHVTGRWLLFTPPSIRLMVTRPNPAPDICKFADTKLS
jgi:hypothetical protein